MFLEDLSLYKSTGDITLQKVIHLSQSDEDLSAARTGSHRLSRPQSGHPPPPLSTR